MFHYKVARLVADLGWVDLDFSAPTSKTLVQPLLPNFNQPKQRGADSGTLKIKVYTTKVCDQMSHPV